MSVVLPGQVETDLSAGLFKAKDSRWPTREDRGSHRGNLHAGPAAASYVPLTFSVIVVAVKFLPKGAHRTGAPSTGANKLIKAEDPAVRKAYDDARSPTGRGR